MLYERLLLRLVPPCMPGDPDCQSLFVAGLRNLKGEGIVLEKLSGPLSGWKRYGGSGGRWA